MFLRNEAKKKEKGILQKCKNIFMYTAKDT